MFEIITDNALDKFNKLCENSTLIRAAIAYWTFPAKVTLSQ